MSEPRPPADDPPPDRAIPWEERVARGEVNRRRVNEAIEQGRRTDAP
jgi:hypothetical protein